nr:MAG TPA: hypothetical protein [Caudoviricetes sp.]
MKSFPAFISTSSIGDSLFAENLYSFLSLSNLSYNRVYLSCSKLYNIARAL